MAIRNDFTILWGLSPRIIYVDAPSVEVGMQDLLDTLRFMEAEPSAMEDASIVTASGKETLDENTKVGLTVELQNALLAFEARPGPEYVQCNVSGGNLVAKDINGDSVSPIHPTAFTQVVRASSSSATLQEQSSIQYSSYNGVITVDITSAYSGTAYPVGTPQEPVNNLSDALAISHIVGLSKLFINTSMVISNEDMSDGHSFIGKSPYVVLTLDPSADLTSCEFEQLTLQGEADGMNSATDCFILDITSANGVFHQCAFGGTVVLNGDVDMFDCFSRVEGGGYPTFLVGANNVVARNHKGSFGVQGATVGHLSSIGVYGGRFVAENTCVGGEVHVRGEPFEIVDSSGAGCTVYREMTSPWDSLLSNYNTEGTFGHDLGHVRYLEHYVYVDTELGVNGDGSQHAPFNNVTDAIDFAETGGIKKLVVLSDLTIDRQIKNFTIQGVGTPTIDCNGQNLDKSEISRCTVTGLYTGSLIVQESSIVGTFAVNGFFENCAINANLVMLDGGAAYIKDCSAFVKGQVPPTIDVGGVAGTADLIITGYDGGIKVINVNQPTDTAKIAMGVGRVMLEASCTDGAINVGGITHLVDSSNGSTVFDETLDPHMLTEVHKSAFNKRVWDKINNTITLYENDGITVLAVFSTDEEMTFIIPQ